MPHTEHHLVIEHWSSGNRCRSMFKYALQLNAQPSESMFGFFGVSKWNVTFECNYGRGKKLVLKK